MYVRKKTFHSVRFRSDVIFREVKKLVETKHWKTLIWLILREIKQDALKNSVEITKFTLTIFGKKFVKATDLLKK